MSVRRIISGYPVTTYQAGPLWEVACFGKHEGRGVVRLDQMKTMLVCPLHSEDPCTISTDYPSPFPRTG
jgi:hypothetical protein